MPVDYFITLDIKDKKKDKQGEESEKLKLI